MRKLIPSALLVGLILSSHSYAYAGNADPISSSRSESDATTVIWRNSELNLLVHIRCQENEFEIVLLDGELNPAQSLSPEICFQTQELVLRSPQEFSLETYALPWPHLKPKLMAAPKTQPLNLTNPEALALQTELLKESPLQIMSINIDKGSLLPFYQELGFEPVFAGLKNSSTQLRSQLLNILENVALYGLNPNRYPVSALRQSLMVPELSHTQLELLWAQAFMNLARDLNTGVLEKSVLESKTQFKKKAFRSQAVLAQSVLRGSSLALALSQIEPQHKTYSELKKELQRVYQIVGQGRWAQIPQTGILKPGQTAAEVGLIREKLRQLGYFAAGTSTTYDTDLVREIQIFQSHSQLKSDGIVGPETRRRLNISSANYINLLRINLERWRWLPTNLYYPNSRKPDQKYDQFTLVNIARQNLEVWENGQLALKMDVVAGKANTKTPQRIDFITSITLNPFWTVPSGVLRRSVLPAAAKDPEYFEKNKFRITRPDGQEVAPNSINWAKPPESVSSFIYRQRPGTHNALGLFRFDLATGDAYYLHHTSEATLNLFAEPSRLFSSGCVRLPKPVEFAEYTFARHGLKESRLPAGGSFAGRQSEILQVISQPDILPSQRVSLARGFFVYLTYFTVDFDANGRPKVAADAYGQDQELLLQL
jgi:murein L,D-transpeptidase YcbB/YkuD